MAMHIDEAMRSNFAAGTQRKQNIENKDVDLASAAMQATAIPPKRRCELRMDYRCLCSYEALKVLEGESVVIEQGTAFALNRSTEGMLLFMRQASQPKQLIEVHTLRSGWGRTANVFEVRWARPVQVESFESLYLVGCRRVFGPCHYLSF
jgi:hypothetical protein